MSLGKEIYLNTKKQEKQPKKHFCLGSLTRDTEHPPLFSSSRIRQRIRTRHQKKGRSLWDFTIGISLWGGGGKREGQGFSVSSWKFAIAFQLLLLLLLLVRLRLVVNVCELFLAAGLLIEVGKFMGR